MKESPLLPYQATWTKDESTIKVCEKSRRIGITWAEALEAVFVAATNGNKGMNVFYVGYNKEMAEEFITTCAEWVRDIVGKLPTIEKDIVKEKEKDILIFRIKFASGYKISALSSKPSNIRGKQGWIIIDEAAFHDDLEGLLKAAIAMKMWGGRISVISTHNGDTNPFNMLVEDIRAGRLKYSLHRITFDQAVKEGLYRRICKKLNKEWSEEAEAAWRDDIYTSYGSAASEELDVIPVSSNDSYFPRELVMGCMSPEIPVLRWKCEDEFSYLSEETRKAYALEWCEENLKPLLEAMDKEKCSFFGLDFARNGALTVIFPLQEQQNISHTCPFIVELRNIPFDQQKEILYYILYRMPRFSFGALDAGGNGAYLAEVTAQKFGSTVIEEIKLTQDWYRENMPKYKAAFEEKTIFIPRDSEILADHRAIKMIDGVAKPRKITKEEKNKSTRHGDSAVAGALALYATQQNRQEYGYRGNRRREKRR